GVRTVDGVSVDRKYDLNEGAVTQNGYRGYFRKASNPALVTDFTGKLLGQNDVRLASERGLSDAADPEENDIRFALENPRRASRIRALTLDADEEETLA
ncbi:unnamed protein product, partial [Amoebophrya sp. A25]